jgi:hypothetical protein
VSKKIVHFIILSLVVFILLVLLAFVGLPMLFASALEGEKSHDFGLVPVERPDTIFEHVFVLKNVTGHTLQLIDAVATCGCTTSDWPDAPVLAGEELLIPVHLKIQRSEHKGSKVRLKFETGEVVVLSIEGDGRFVQPMQCYPPDIKIVDGDTEGSRYVLSTEWYKVSKPPIPTFKTPEQITVVPDQWVLSTEGNTNRGTPDVWTLRFRIVLDGTLQENSTISFELPETPLYSVPIRQVKVLDKPKPVYDPNRR